MKEGSRPQLYRLQRMIQMMREGARSGHLPNSTDFMAEFGVSRRTVVRDLEILRDKECAPLEYDDTCHGFRLTDEIYDPTTIQPNKNSARKPASHQPTHAYRQVADTLRKQILTGEIAQNECLPSERELCQRFSTSRITIRRAMQILADETLVQRMQGSGTFACPTPSHKMPVFLPDFGGSSADHSRTSVRHLEFWQWRKAADEVAIKLQLRSLDRVLFARRIEASEGEPRAFDEIHLLEQSADQLGEQDLSRLHFFEHWQEVQKIRIARVDESIEAAIATPAQARYLEIEPGALMMKFTKVMFLDSGEPCGLFFCYYPNDRYCFTSTINLPQVPSEQESS